jgi:hypothetical protein
VIPPFEKSGNRPAGIHETTWNEFAARYGITPHRRNLLDGLTQALESLRRAGCRRAYVDGSFVTAKHDPGDFDACWEASNVDPMLLDPALIDFSDRRRAQKLKFGGELFPADLPADPAGTRFLEHFQLDRSTREPKGIVAVNLTDLP